MDTTLQWKLSIVLSAFFSCLFLSCKKSLSWSFHFNTTKKLKDLGPPADLEDYIKMAFCLVIRELMGSFSCNYSRELPICRNSFGSRNKFHYFKQNMVCYSSPRKTYVTHFFLWTSYQLQSEINLCWGREEYIQFCLSKSKHKVQTSLNFSKPLSKVEVFFLRGKPKQNMKNYSCLNSFYGILPFKSFKAPS